MSDENAPRVLKRIIIAMLAARWLLLIGESLVGGDHPAGFGEGNDRRDAIIAAEAQAWREFLARVDRQVRSFP